MQTETPAQSSEQLQPKYPDAVFQIGDRVESRYKGVDGHALSRRRYPGVVLDVFKLGRARRRPKWAFTICFDDGYEEVVELVMFA